MATDNIVIVAAKRTAMGGFMGGLSDVDATVLGASAIKAALEQAGLSGDKVSEVIMGNVLPAGLGQAPARQATLKAGLPLTAVGAHLLQSYRLTPLGVNIIPLLLLLVLLVCAILGWLLLIVPLQYFVFLITGAFSRAALTSSAQLVAKANGVKVDITERHGIRPINTAAGEWDASMRDKPFTLTNTFTAALLFVLGMLLN